MSNKIQSSNDKWGNSFDIKPTLKGEMNLIKAEIRFLVVLTIIAITLMNPVAAEIIKRLLKL